MDAADERARRRERALLLGLLALLAVIYVRGLAGQPTDWDDDVWLGDPVVSSPPLEAVKLAFGTVRTEDWAPVLRLSFAGLLALGGPWAVHAAVLAELLALVAGVWVVLRRLGLGVGTVLGAVAPWALHPTKVECVAWLTGLKDVQSGALLAGAAVVATSPGSPRRTALFGLLCALAGMTKAATFPVPLVVLLALAAVHGREEAWRRAWAGVLASLGIALVGWTVWGADPEAPDLVARLIRVATVYGAFCGKLVPTSLPAALTPLPSLGAALAAGLAVTVPMVALALRDRRGWLALALWVLPLVPFVGLAHMAFWGSDRHLLFASLGPFLALSFALGEVRAPVVGVPAALLLAVPTWLRVPEWHDSLTLWEAESRRPGDHWVRGHKLGTALGRAGRFEEAVRAFDRSLALEDDGPTLARRLLASLAADGWTKADAAVVPFLEPPPADQQGWRRAAEALQRAGRPDLAEMATRRVERAATAGAN